MANPRAKGKRGEYEVRDLIRAVGFPCERTPNSGGLFVPGDHHDGNGRAAIPGIHVEAKLHAHARLPEWLAQAYSDAPEGAQPLVAWRLTGHRGKPAGSWRADVELPWLLGLLAQTIEPRG